MTSILKEEALPEASDTLFSAIGQVTRQLETIEKFVSRRFDEISAEIYATSQQMDMAEKGSYEKFSEIMTALSSISYKGDGTTPANSGAELDAVVDMTEEAANKILDAAGRINQAIHRNTDWDSKETRAQVLENINKDVEEIFLACSFQDLTSQRIRKALDNIKLIEDRLGSTLEKLGIPVNVQANPNLASGVSQGDIDALFSGKK